jgi:hypothetical protein
MRLRLGPTRKEGRGSVDFVVIRTTSLDIALRQYVDDARARAILQWTVWNEVVDVVLVALVTSLYRSVELSPALL